MVAESRGIRLRAGADRPPSPTKKSLRISNSSINDGVGLDKRYRRWLELKWLTPSRLVPHGAAGIVTLTLGLMLTLGSLRGRFGLLETAWAVPVYCGFTAANAAAGYAMAPRARKTAQMPFKVAALAQLCLTWVAFRFRPSAGPGPGINGGSALPHREAWAFTQVERSLDVVAAIVLLLANAAMVFTALTVVRVEIGNAAAVAICGGSFGLLLLSAYPVHLAIGGDEWLNCVVDQYPMQLQGFAGYVYVPTTFVFSAMLFGATLLDRAVITSTFFGVVFGGFVAGTVVVNVIVQELHIPYVSTQRLILPCPEAANGTVLFTIGEVLDTSRLAQNVLRGVGITLPPPPS